MGRSMDRVHGVVHGPGPWGGPWTPVHVLYTSELKQAKREIMDLTKRIGHLKNH